MKVAVIAAWTGVAACVMAGAVLLPWPYVLGVCVGVAVERLADYSDQVLCPREHEEGHQR